jgi:DNA-binding NarL/FixJ family response regulator
MRKQFTPREREILALVAKATLRKKIAHELSISIRTVDTHLQSIHKKTNTTTMGELILFSLLAEN